MTFNQQSPLGYFALDDEEPKSLTDVTTEQVVIENSILLLVGRFA